jgi:hypothetical protein
MKKIKCHDCKKEISVKGDQLLDGKILEYQNQDEKIIIAKCDDCYNLNKKLINFQECEVYSRVVGYIRPIQQWSVGKRKEYDERKNYKNS